MKPKYRNEDWLREKYWGEMLSSREITRVCSASNKATILYWLDKLEIDKRDYNWTEEEEKFVEDNYGEMLAEDIAEELGRTVSSIRNRANRLDISGIGVNKYHDYWTEEEEKYLKKNYGKCPASEIAEELEKKRTSIYNKAKREGLMHKGNQFDEDARDGISYILGVLKGDGCVYVNEDKPEYLLQLQVGDKPFAMEFKEKVKSIGLPTSVDFIPKQKIKLATKCYWRVRAYSQPFTQWYSPLTYEDIREYLETNFRKEEFLRGFYESDGCLNYKSRRLSITNTDRDLLKLAKGLFGDLGFKFFLKDYDDYSRIEIYKKSEIKSLLRLLRPVIQRRSISAMGGDDSGTFL